MNAGYHDARTALIGELLIELNAAFPSSARAKDAESTITVYVNGLNDLSLEALRWAVRESIRHDEFFPKVARLRAIAQRFQQTSATAALTRNTSAQATGWCSGCNSFEAVEQRYRPALDAKFARIYDGAKRIKLERFERLYCRCSAASSWTPDGTDDLWATQQ